jgi:hypothetical protein
MRKRIGPTPDRAERITLFSILARIQAGRHWVYSGHYPRIFVAPMNAQNAETNHRSRAVPILLLTLSALMTRAYTSLGFLQELNPQPQLLKTPVYHSATSAGVFHSIKRCILECPALKDIHIGTTTQQKKLSRMMFPMGLRVQCYQAN